MTVWSCMSHRGRVGHAAVVRKISWAKGAGRHFRQVHTGTLRGMLSDLRVLPLPLVAVDVEDHTVCLEQMTTP